MLVFKIQFLLCQYVDSFPLNYMLKFEKPRSPSKISFFFNLMEAPIFFGKFHLMICKSNSVKKYPKFIWVIKMYLNSIIPL